LGCFARGLTRRAVVIVPSSLKGQWLSEINDKSNPKFRPARIRVVSGDLRWRRELYRSPWQVLIISHDIARIDAEILARFAPTVGLTIVDEASILRNAGKTADAIVRTFPTAFRVALTATPIENGLADLYNVFRWVDRRIFISRKYFDDRYIVFRRQHWNVKLKNKKGVAKMRRVVPHKYVNLPEVKAKIRPAFIRRTAKEVAVELPEITFTREAVELSAKQRAVYERVAERTKRFLEQHPELAGEALASPLVPLRQACDAPELVEEGRGLGIAAAKVERLKELLDGELRGEQVIIFSDFEQFVRLLARELRAFKPVCFTGPMSETERRISIHQFVRGYRRVLIGTKALERGHNLQVAEVVVNADLPWSPAALKQRLGRARRMESKHQVIRVRDLYAVGTIEETLILPKLSDKHKLFEEVIGEDELSRREEDVYRGVTARSVRELL
jgi:SNF2 family DNA or RNA helicase